MLNYFKEVQAEMRHVSWPTRSQILMSTGVVIVISLVAATYLGLWDYLFTLIIKQIV